MTSRDEATAANGSAAPSDFIRAMVAEDLRTNKHGGRVATRFPPEPNGYLHIGHAKSICLNFGIAEENHGGTCNLRFDDTNPETEEMRYVESIQQDVRWLGFDWDDRLYFASDYFQQLHGFAVKLIENGKAYVDSSSEAEIRELRGTVTTPGKESPYASRSVEENLDLFERMRAGEFEDVTHVLRARIDMTSSNMQMRDPILYRIRHAEHYRTGNDWCLYPLYDFTHCLSDAIERITHSLCSLEFKDNRELYDWIVDAVGFDMPPKQTEFARLNLDYTVLSKRKLVQLVREGHVDGWDDPRMPTIAGFRRRGVTPEAIRTFCDTIGVAKVDSRVDIDKLEHAVRDDLNMRVPRVMCVLRPLKVVIDNYPEHEVEELDAPFYPHDVPKEGSRKLPFSREIYIERDDFLEDPPKKFFRLAPGREVRLRYAYLIRCEKVIKDPVTGSVTELHCTYDPDSKGGKAPDGRKVKGTLHWVSAEHSLPAEIRLYDRLFSVPDPDANVVEGDFTANLNPESKVILREARVEPAVAEDPAGARYQFERSGYFCSDSVDSRSGALVFNRTVGLRDTWAKMTSKGPDKASRVSRKPSASAKPAQQSQEGPARDKSQVERTPEVAARIERYTSELGLVEDDAEIIAASRMLTAIFEEGCEASGKPKSIANWVVNDLRREAKGDLLADLPVSGATIAKLVNLVDTSKITRTVAREVFAEMVRDGGDPAEIVREKGLEQVSEPDSIEPVVDSVMDRFPDKVQEYRGGRKGLLGFFIGEVMRASEGRANPALVKELVQKKLG